MTKHAITTSGRDSRRMLAALLAGTALTMGAATPSFAQNVDDTAAEESNDNVIVVSGIRASLESALGEKRASNNIVEVIQAEDIGKLPDQNLAEVLENVTGIQITRQAGVGNAVQIRGTDANRTEINGVSTVGSGAGRSGISFEDLPAALISAVEVTKVPEAKTIEGSVGGTINLKTIRPLSLNEPLIAARVQYENSDLAKTTLPRISGTIGNRFETGIGEIGIVLSGSYARQDVAQFAPRVDRDAINLANSGPSSENFNFLQIQFFQQETNNFEYETYNGTAALEWKPADNLRLYFDATLNDQQRSQESNRVQLSGVSSPLVVNTTNNTAFETVNLGSLNGPNGPINLGSIQSTVAGTLGIGGVSGATVDPNLRTSSDTGSRVTKSRVFDAGFEWEGEKLTVRAEAALSTSKTTNPNFSTTLDFINPLGPQPVFGRGSLDNGVPLAFDLRNGLTFGIDQNSPFAPSAEQLLNPANYQINQVSQGASRSDNKEKAVRFDFTYDTTDLNPFVTSVDFGYRWNETSAINNDITNNISLTANGSNNAAALLANRFNRPEGDLFADILIAAPTNFNSVDGRELFFRDFLIIDGALSFNDPAAVLSALNDAITASNTANPTLPAVPLLAGPTESAVGFFSIKEKTNAAYIQANMEGEIFGMPARGNIGLRWLSTTLASTGNNVANGVATGTTTRRSKYNFLLPRFSAVLEPASDVLLRAGIARDIRRPNFDDLSTSRNFSTSAEAFVEGGNPNLIPEVVWSFDLSGEYYFTRSSLISVGFFHKNRTNLFGTLVDAPTPIGFVGVNPQFSIDPNCPGGGIFNPLANRNINNVANPGNGICAPLSSKFNVPGSTTQTGIEIAFQHDLSAYEDALGFASGFGFIGNFTYQKEGGSAESFFTGLRTRELDVRLGFDAGELQSKITLPNLSKYAYNATVFYDKYGLNARLRYTWRSDYVTNEQQRWNLPVIAGARGQLNASINYDITDNINVGIEGINLLREDQQLFCVNNNAVLCFQGFTDRRITGGISVKF
ncbi:TonB-dependent receptor [Sphingorhabdus arenilitoris]|uniref:TonB-dependent receptor n=1 Tax=Sphingorhabdus arenilitoris TaxID=1490041 RepID=A0ABV8RIF9_9SPHN